MAGGKHIYNMLRRLPKMLFGHRGDGEKLPMIMHSFIISSSIPYCLPRPPARVSRWSVHFREKKKSIPHGILIRPRLCNIGDRFYSYPLSQFCYIFHDVCYWILDFLHGLRQSAARVHRRCQCDPALHCLRSSEQR